MITVAIKPPFNNPQLYANPFFYPVLQQLLSANLVLYSFGSVCAFPGARDQHVHLDHPWFFDSPALSGGMGPYAITVVIPLVDIDLTVGTTAIWEGSHRGGNPNLDMFSLPDAVFPSPRMGDVYLMDYRLVHGGTANNSRRARPIMYLVYSRHWFRDHVNYTKQPRISISPEEFAQVSEAQKPLFRNCDVREQIRHPVPECK
jgi:ectoine hydroxylase-related dioxygenase (phytanoyl-CoA dioxygenase family)